MYWPGITNDITLFVSQREACQKHQKRTQKEPLLQPEPPCRPWERLSSDLFEYRGQHYLLLSDHYSKFPIIRKLTRTSSFAIINHMKAFSQNIEFPPNSMGHSTVAESFASSRSHMVQTYHKLPTISPLELICRVHGADSQKYTTQM